MRILIVTHYFPPETGAPQARLSALAATWAGDGDRVTVLTGMPNHPTGVIPPEYGAPCAAGSGATATASSGPGCTPRLTRGSSGRPSAT